MAQGAVESVLRSFLLSQKELKTLSTAQRKVSQVGNPVPALLTPSCAASFCCVQRLPKLGPSN